MSKQISGKYQVGYKVDRRRKTAEVVREETGQASRRNENENNRKGRCEK